MSKPKQSERQVTNSEPQPAAPPAAKPSSVLPVLAAYLHQPVMMPGGQTESSITQLKLPGIKLGWAVGEGLLVRHKNQKALIPAANVAVAYFDDAQPE